MRDFLKNLVPVVYYQYHKWCEIQASVKPKIKRLYIQIRFEDGSTDSVECFKEEKNV